MKIQIHKDLHNPQTLDVTRVVVLDDFDNPLAIAVEISSGIIITATADGDIDEFNALLRNLGINKTVMVHTAQQRSLPTIQIPGA